MYCLYIFLSLLPVSVSFSLSFLLSLFLSLPYSLSLSFFVKCSVINILCIPMTGYQPTLKKKAHTNHEMISYTCQGSL